MTERSLINRLKEKDQNALEETIAQYTPLVAGLIRNMAKGSLSEEDMEETVVDVFVTLWNNTDHLIEGKLKGYLCAIAKTKALTKITAVNRHVALDIDDVDPEDDFSITSEVEKKEIIGALREIIADIGMPEKEIIIRYYYYCQTITQIAKVMQLNPETAKTKLRRTREKIKVRLTERGYMI